MLLRFTNFHTALARRLGAFFLFGSLLGSAQGSPVLYVATDQTGAQTQIDAGHTSSWIFTPGSLFDLAGGIFEMKSGVSATADITFALYSGTDATGNVLASVVLDQTSFCGQVSNCSQFGSHLFSFTVPVELSVGTTYFAALTSSAVDTQSTAYFIKSTGTFITDLNLFPITPSPVVFGLPASPSSEVPEPSTFLLAGSLLTAFWWTRRRFSVPGNRV